MCIRMLSALLAHSFARFTRCLNVEGFTICACARSSTGCSVNRTASSRAFSIALRTFGRLPSTSASNHFENAGASVASSGEFRMYIRMNSAKPSPA